MTLEEFAEEMKIRIQNEVGSSCQLKLEQTWGINGIPRFKLAMKEIENGISRTVTLNRYFGEPEEDISELELMLTAMAILKEYSPENSLERNSGNMKDSTTDYESCKDRICFGLVNTDMNQELLKYHPHIPFLDLSVLFYIMPKQNGERMEDNLVNEEVREAWNVTAEELYQQAMRNIPEKMSVVFLEANMELAKLLLEEPDEITSLPEVETIKDNVPYYLSNPTGNYGAAVILYPGILKNYAEKCGKDLIILPCSVHEVMVMSLPDKDRRDRLTNIVRQLNRFKVPEEVVLSDHMYRYDYQTGMIQIV